MTTNFQFVAGEDDTCRDEPEILSITPECCYCLTPKVLFRGLIADSAGARVEVRSPIRRPVRCGIVSGLCR